MSRNRQLQFFYHFTGAIIIIAFLLFAFFLFVQIHSYKRPDFYTNWFLINPYQAGLRGFQMLIGAKGETGIPLSEIQIFDRIWLVLRSGILTTFIIAMLWHFRAILKTVQQAQVFYQKNIYHFNRMAFWALLLSFFSAFNLGNLHSNPNLNFTIPFGCLMLAGGFKVLAEVFREGKRLSDDSNSII